jgi:hypothetical protein
MKVTEHEHPEHGWGYAIKDDDGNIIVQFLNSHTDAKTDDLKNSTRQLAQEEHQKLTDKKDKP